MKTYELIDHTADVGVKAYGKTISEAFENAAKGMFDIITDKSEIENIGQYNIELKAPDLEQLLVDFLSDLLFLNSAKNLVFSFFIAHKSGNNKGNSLFLFQSYTFFNIID